MGDYKDGLFKVYRSSAGSGKTYTLVKEYLKLVLAAPYKYKRILAVTFTNKAANEMKERIIKQLSALCYGEDFSNDSLALDLQKETRLSFEELRKNAKTVLQNILHHYSDFAVSTIDSFTYRIVSTFSYDLKLPLQFDVELENETLISEAVNAIMGKIGSDPELTKTLVQFAEENLIQGKNWQVDADLKRLSSEIFKEYAPFYLDQIKYLSLSDFRNIAGELSKSNKIFKENVEKVSRFICSQIERQGLSEEDFYRGKQGIYTYFKNLCKFNKDKLLPNSYVLSTLQQDKWYSAKADMDAKQKIDDLKQGIADSFEELQTLYESGLEIFISQELLLENLYSLALLNEISHVIQEYSKENSVLHISEFNKHIADFISKEPVPFIYERIGERYDHYFIDEFQDTSVLQWQNILPLIENSLAKGESSLLVGDAKQAIYRFRQGEVEQFIELPNIYKRGDDPFLLEREKILHRNFHPEALNKNFRSRREIVTFNNDFFEFSSYCLNEKYKPIYLGNEQKNDPGLKQQPIKDGGYVCIEFLEKDDYKARTCERTYHAISETLLAGYRYKDVAILARSKKELNVIAEYLSAKEINGQKISLISSESFWLWNSPEVRFLYSILQFLADPNQRVAQLQILQFLQQRKTISQEEKEQYFIRLYQTKQENLAQFLRAKNLDIHPEILLQYSIYDIIESVVRVFGLDKEANPYIIAFLNYAADWLTNPSQNLSDFLEKLDEKIKGMYIKIPDDLDAIRLMTIHKSKGLEFPVVIYPFADSELKMQNNLWVQNTPASSLPSGLIKLKKEAEKSLFKSDYEEERQKSTLDLLNVLYVALTRASECLYAFTKELPSESEKISYAALFKNYLMKKDLWNAEQKIYEFGTKERTLSDDENRKPKKQYVLEEFISAQWYDKIVINYRIPAYWNPAKPGRQIEKGVLLHQALSYIISEEDIPVAIAKLLKEGLMEHELAGEFERYLSDFLSNPVIKPFFEKGLKVKTEEEIILENGKSLRLDRIIFKSDATIIIDFKTGKFLESHQDQIQKYKSVISRMGYPDIKTYLIYLQENGVECNIVN